MKDKRTIPLFYGGQPGDGYGWGVCNQNLIRELSLKLPLVPMNSDSPDWINQALPGDLFTPIRNESMTPTCPARGKRTFGYTFFETFLSKGATATARTYDHLFAGSSWCADQLRASGVESCSTLIQGIDPVIFHPSVEDPPLESPFVIFSGGKLELRKGQDLVIRAIQVLRARYPDILLVCAWNNPWESSLQTLAASPHLRFIWEGTTWSERVSRLCLENGLDPSGVKILPQLSHTKLASLYRKTHIGLFPNRCEGGTNLALMEYMACGRPVIASHWSGHTDILTPESSFFLTPYRTMQIHNSDHAPIAAWPEACIEQIVEALDYAYHHRAELTQKGKAAGQRLSGFNWEKSAQTLLEIL